MIGVAVVGCGYWGPNLIRNFRLLQGCKIKMICDTNRDRIEDMRQLYPELETTDDLDHIIKRNDIDAVVIATPTRLHFEIGKRSLQAGKHTFIEKPLATSIAQCEELLQIANKMKLTLMVGHTFIYSCPVRKIKEIVNSGELGEIQYISSRRLNLGLFQKDINVAWDLAPHDISIILYILDEMPVFVGCHGKAHVTSGIEDVTNITLNFKNGGFAIIHNSWLDPNKVREITFVGTNKMLVYDDIEPIEKIKIYDKCVKIPPHYNTFAEFNYSYHYGDIHTPYIKQVEPLKLECEHFLDCIKTGVKPDSSGIEGLNVVKILEAASKSMRDGGAEIPLASIEKVVVNYDSKVSE